MGALQQGKPLPRCPTMYFHSSPTSELPSCETKAFSLANQCASHRPAVIMAAAMVSLAVFGAASALFELQVPAELAGAKAQLWAADAAILTYLPNFYLQVGFHSVISTSLACTRLLARYE